MTETSRRKLAAVCRAIVANLFVGLMVYTYVLLISGLGFPEAGFIYILLVVVTA
jgi:formate/nitrite transporter FocA (FNT family)